MADRKIKNELTADYQLIGIAGSLKEYKLCFHLNSVLNCDFRKLADLTFESNPAERGRKTSFSVFKAGKESDLNRFLVFSNKTTGEVLLPEVSNFDFILKIEGKYEGEELKSAVEAIRQLPGVVMSAEIPVSKVRQRDRLVYEEERSARRLITTKRI